MGFRALITIEDDGEGNAARINGSNFLRTISKAKTSDEEVYVGRLESGLEIFRRSYA
jgi:hypothetical protein